MNNVNHEAEKELMKIIGNYAKKRRLQRNLSQVDLADLSGISMASITRFETGKGNISLLNLLAIINILGIADELKEYFLTKQGFLNAGHERVRWSRKSPAENIV